jgi:integrase
MKPFRKALAEYLTLRRGLGAELKRCGWALHRFVEFLELEGASRITRELALRWATQPAGAQQSTWALRLGYVRGFADWLSTVDASSDVVPLKLLPFRFQRKPPYIYTDDELLSLIRAARRLPSYRGMRSLSCATLFGLQASTGLRLSEALALDEGDVDLANGVLHVRRTKFGKSRFIPVHDSTRQALQRYVQRRDQLLPCRATDAFLVSDRGGRFCDCAARYSFALVSRNVGLRRPAGGHRHGRGPRLHDMRHRFAATRLLEWYRAGMDVEREIPKLATYLGHVHVNETYWYLEAVPELLQLATKRLQERFLMEVEP